MGKAKFREITQLANETCTVESLAGSFIVSQSGNQINTYFSVLLHQFTFPEGRRCCCSELNSH